MNTTTINRPNPQSFTLLSGVPQYTNQVDLASLGKNGQISIQLATNTGSVAVAFEASATSDFTPVPYTQAIVAAHTVGTVLYPVDSIPVAARGRFKLTSDATVSATARVLTL